MNTDKRVTLTQAEVEEIVVSLSTILGDCYEGEDDEEMAIIESILAKLQ